MHYVQPKKNANITISNKSGKKVQAKFHHGVNGRWTLAFGIAKVELMASFEDVELGFICDEQIYSAKARVTAVNSSVGSCVIDNINDYISRPLRGENRIDVHLPCSVIVRDDQDTRSIFIDKQKNQISNLSCTGALLSTSAFQKSGSSLLLLFALDVHLDLEPIVQRMYMRGTIVREQGNIASSFAHHYGIRFGNTNPSFEHLLKTFLEYKKLNPSASGIRAA
jgi:hypothetical protein